MTTVQNSFFVIVSERYFLPRLTLHLKLDGKKGIFMSFIFLHGDITKLQVDAIVNAANKTLLGGGGVDGAIHKAAGSGLLNECKTLGGCETGEAKITNGYNLPCEYVIHTVGPIWKIGGEKKRAQLASCYKNSLCLAVEKGCNSVAFPLISAGAYGCPKDIATKIAIDTISAFLQEHDMTVYLVVFDNRTAILDENTFKQIDRYINDNCKAYASLCYSRSIEAVPMMAEMSSLPDGLEKIVDEVDESFSQMLLRKIDEKGMTDVQCYKKANVDRKLFSKIRNDIHYRPSKTTAIAFAIALELSLEETDELLLKAGFALSHSSKFDIIVEYFIKNKNYNIFEINEALFAFDQQLLGV